MSFGMDFSLGLKKGVIQILDKVTGKIRQNISALASWDIKHGAIMEGLVVAGSGGEIAYINKTLGKVIFKIQF